VSEVSNQPKKPRPMRFGKWAVKTSGSTLSKSHGPQWVSYSRRTTTSPYVSLRSYHKGAIRKETLF